MAVIEKWQDKKQIGHAWMLSIWGGFAPHKHLLSNFGDSSLCQLKLTLLASILSLTHPPRLFGFDWAAQPWRVFYCPRFAPTAWTVRHAVR
jgi:hypothetical protein